MKAGTSCNNCGSKEFLGVECAWPSTNCVGEAQARRTVRTRWARRLILAVAAVTISLGAWQIGQAGYIHAKALLARVLIKQAWAETRNGVEQARPWPWADTWPVARIAAPAHDADLYVLAGADDRTIAFGPGHMFGTALPGEPGNSVIGGHRDTHFAFLEWLEDGDEIEVHTARGTNMRYLVAHTRVVDKEDLEVLAQPANGSRLTLVTCYPFGALRAGSPLRYVVTAIRAETPEDAAYIPSARASGSIRL